MQSKAGDLYKKISFFHGKKKGDEFFAYKKQLRENVQKILLASDETVYRSKHYSIIKSDKKYTVLSRITGRRDHATNLYKEKLYALKQDGRFIYRRCKYFSTERIQYLLERLNQIKDNNRRVSDELCSVIQDSRDDHLASYLFRTKFKPLYDDKYFEIKTVDLASPTWVSKNGIKIDNFIHGLVEDGVLGHDHEGYHNDNVEGVRDLKSDVQSFMQTWSSASAYRKEKKDHIKTLKNYPQERNEFMSSVLSIPMINGDARLLENALEKILKKRGVIAGEEFSEDSDWKDTGKQGIIKGVDDECAGECPF